jgi:hypothetical protein
VHQYDAVEILRVFAKVLHEGRAFVRLQTGKENAARPVVPHDKIDGSVAEIAHAVEQHNGVIG